MLALVGLFPAYEVDLLSFAHRKANPAPRLAEDDSARYPQHYRLIVQRVDYKSDLLFRSKEVNRIRERQLRICSRVDGLLPLDRPLWAGGCYGWLGLDALERAFGLFAVEVYVSFHNLLSNKS
jgi:hypothetical protein